MTWEDNPENPQLAVPAPPWQMSGTMAMGIFRLTRPPEVPAPLRRVMPRHIAVVVIRYRTGTLSYDEFVIGLPVRHGPQVGICVTSIWVNDQTSLQGGRRLWGLPKQPARFAWTRNGVGITDRAGVLASISISPGRLSTPPISLEILSFNTPDRAVTRTTSRLHAPWTAARLQVDHWSALLPPLSQGTTRFAAVANPFTFTINGPERLDQ